MNASNSQPKATQPLSIKEIFLAAREVTAGEPRDRYLTEAIGDDQELRRRIDRMLASEECSNPRPLAQAVDNLDLAAYDVTTGPAINVSEHPLIGPYKLLERLGTGGMGEVFVAEQRQPVRRTVALKLIKRGMDSKDVIARFEAERQALAMMSHPNIASVLDAGQTEDGRPYFVMDLVRGIRITDYCDRHKLDLRERLKLMVTVCQAVQHAHQKGIIHRDLKPGNILVELDDVRHIPKVIDFGVAKATNQRLTEHTLFTQFSQMIGTPLYMSPEQAQMTSMDVDTRSDVYSLGVVLYELLTGSTPFDKDTLNKAGYDEMRRIIQEDEPPRPSHRMSTLKAERLSTLTERQQKGTPQLEHQVERELDWIVMKALEKDRVRRYESASALAADLQCYLDGDLVQACPPSVGYRFRKYAKRHKGLLTTAALLVATMLLATGVSVSYAVQADQARDDANGEKNKAVAAQQKSEQDFATALDAIDRLLKHASDPIYRDTPQTQLILKKALEDSLEFYERFTVNSEASPEVLFRAADTRGSLGRLAGDLKQYDLAQETLEEARANLEDLKARFPEEIKYRTRLAWAYIHLGWYYDHTSPDPAKAIENFNRARDEYKSLAKLDKKNSGYHRVASVRASVEGDDAYKALGKLDQYHELVFAAHDELKQLGDYLGRSDVDFVVKCKLADILESTDPAHAESLHLEIVEKIRQRQQTSQPREIRMSFALRLRAAGRFLSERHHRDADDLQVQAVDISAALASEFPGISDYREVLRESLKVRISHGCRNASTAELARIVSELQRRFPDDLKRLHVAYSGRLARVEDPIAALSLVIEQFPEQGLYYSYRAAKYRDRGEFDLALTDLNKAIKTNSEPRFDTQFREARADVYIDLNQFDKAREELKAVLESGDKTCAKHYRVALLALRTDDRTLHRKLCQKMLTDFTGSEAPDEKHSTAWTCALAADAIEDYPAAIKLARYAVEKEPGKQQFLTGLGAILMRSGQYAAAKVELEKALAASDTTKTSQNYSRYFLAMTEHHLGHEQAAAAQLKGSNECAAGELSKSPEWSRTLTLELLRMEAEALIGKPDDAAAENGDASLDSTESTSPPQ